MSTSKNRSNTEEEARRSGLARSKRFILIVMLIWLAQAIPKWVVVITADGEQSAKIMRVFVTPRTDLD